MTPPGEVSKREARLDGVLVPEWLHAVAGSGWDDHEIHTPTAIPGLVHVRQYVMRGANGWPGLRVFVYRGHIDIT